MRLELDSRACEVRRLLAQHTDEGQLRLILARRAGKLGLQKSGGREGWRMEQHWNWPLRSLVRVEGCGRRITDPQPELSKGAQAIFSIAGNEAASNLGGRRRIYI